jgi:hypothetical protein
MHELELIKSDHAKNYYCMRGATLGTDAYFAKLINTLIYTQFQPQAHDLVK